MAEESSSAMLSGADVSEGTDFTVPEGSWLSDFDLEPGIAKSLSKFQTPEDALKGYAELNRHQGSMLNPPKDEDSDEEKARKLDNIYKRLGRPDSPDGYELTKPEGLPEGLDWSDEMAAEAKKVAHRLGLNQSQLSALLEWDIQRQSSAVKIAQSSEQENMAKAQQSLKDEWGMAAYEGNLAKAEKAYSELAGDPVKRAKLFLELFNEHMSEAQAVRSDGQGGDRKPAFLNYPSMQEK